MKTGAWLEKLQGEAETRNQFLGDTLPRGFALFIGLFALLNLVAHNHAPWFNPNLWWLDTRVLPPFLSQLLLLVSALVLVGFAVQPPQFGWRRSLTLCMAGALGLAALFNSIEFYLLLFRGTVTAGFPIALSMVTLLGLVLVVLATRRRPALQPRANTTRRASVIITSAGCALAFALLQMLCFGKTDYRRPADAVVVLGARAYADGRPSDALADRVRTACVLYRNGLAHKLIFSGGPGDGAVHETAAMKHLAVRLGVNPADILVDEAGLNTKATVQNTTRLLKQLHASRVLVVSHFHHLPRIKLAYEAAGWNVYTVPAKESYLLRQIPYNMAREVAAFWVYYLRAVV